MRSTMYKINHCPRWNDNYSAMLDAVQTVMLIPKRRDGWHKSQWNLWIGYHPFSMIDCFDRCIAYLIRVHPQITEMAVNHWARSPAKTKSTRFQNHPQGDNFGSPPRRVCWMFAGLCYCAQNCVWLLWYNQWFVYFQYSKERTNI